MFTYSSVTLQLRCCCLMSAWHVGVAWYGHVGSGWVLSKLLLPCAHLARGWISDLHTLMWSPTSAWANGQFLSWWGHSHWGYCHPDAVTAPCLLASRYNAFIFHHEFYCCRLVSVLLYDASFWCGHAGCWGYWLGVTPVTRCFTLTTILITMTGVLELVKFICIWRPYAMFCATAVRQKMGVASVYYTAICSSGHG